jgi:hypothetical protein
MSKPTKHYGGWRVRWTDADGKRQSVVLEHRAPVKRSEKDDQSTLRRHLLPAFGGLLLSQVTVERIDVWRNEVEVSPKTAARLARHYTVAIVEKAISIPK